MLRREVVFRLRAAREDRPEFVRLPLEMGRRCQPEEVVPRARRRVDCKGTGPGQGRRRWRNMKVEVGRWIVTASHPVAFGPDEELRSAAGVKTTW